MGKLMNSNQDWDVTRDAFTSWWKHEKAAVPTLSISSPCASPLPSRKPKSVEGARNQWLDLDRVIPAYEEGFARTKYHGMAYPYFTPNLGPGSLALFLGSHPDFAESTVWYNPCFKDPAKVDLRMLFNNEYWLWTLEATKRALKESQGRYIVGLPDIIEGLDILAGLFGTQELLMHLLDCPEEIHRLLDQLDDIYWQAFDPLHDLVKDERKGNTFIAFQIWGPGKTLKVQCDFSAMISPDMFAEFVCPHLERQCARADFSLYHLDGPSCLCHLKPLLELVPSLDAVQWTPGAGNDHICPADPIWWDVMWRPVLASGRSAHVLGNAPSMIKPFVKEFGWKGVYLGTGVDSEDEAKALFDQAVGW